MGLAGMVKRVPGIALLCALLFSHPALAEGSGTFYGKFRPLEGAGDAPPASTRGGRYSGETGYFRPKSRSGAPRFVGPGYPNSGASGASRGRYGMSPHREWRPQPKFRPDHRRRNPDPGRARPTYRPQSGPGVRHQWRAPPESGTGYRFRPQGHAFRGDAGFQGEA